MRVEWIPWIAGDDPYYPKSLHANDELNVLRKTGQIERGFANNFWWADFGMETIVAYTRRDYG